MVSKVFAVVSVLVLLSLHCEAQIPTVCAQQSNLINRECCPNAMVNDMQLQCGGPTRGSCRALSNPPSSSNTDIRNNWPHYFNRVCVCIGNYGDYDCSGCKYGYYGDQCQYKATLPRRSLSSLSASEWRKYLNILNMTKYEASGYSVILSDTYQSSAPNAYSSLVQQGKIKSISIYDLFTWSHHYSAKNFVTVDYAHKSTGFPTWHRQMLLWFEYQVQKMLKRKGNSDYYTFRTSFWDWTEPSERIKYFTPNRLGRATYDPNDPTLPTGIQWDLYGETQWKTICWPDPPTSPCDPSITGAQYTIKRCARNDMYDPCNNASYQFWPSSAHVDEAIAMRAYDNSPYGRCAEDSFRNYMEGFLPPTNDNECQQDLMCQPDEANTQGCNAHRRLHNSVHLILGSIHIRGLRGSSSVPANKQGVMAAVPSSPNDPIFINHHAMIDCILEDWLKKYPTENLASLYPRVTSIPKGHGFNDYIVPFFPVFTNGEMFKHAETFGYYCGACKLKAAILPLLSLTGFILVVLIL